MSQQYFEVVSSNYVKNHNSMTQNNAKYSAKEPAHQHLSECSTYFHAESNGIVSDEIEAPFANESFSTPSAGYDVLEKHSAIPASKALTRYMNQAIGLDSMVQEGVKRIEQKTRALLAIKI